MADTQTAQTSKAVSSLDGGSFGLDIFVAVAEASILGTLVDVGLVALSNLPTVLITAGNAPYVATAIAAVTAALLIRKAYANNRE